MTKLKNDFHFKTITGNREHRVLKFSHHAMATLFEIYLLHEDPSYAEQAAAEAFRLLPTLEQDLSRFISNSDISRVNHLGAITPVKVGWDTFACLERCQELYRATFHAFDISVGPLYDLWLNPDKTLKNPSHLEIQDALQRIGMEHVVLDADLHEVFLQRQGMSLDLGGFAKGYALDRMAEFLIEWDIKLAFLHGGTSSTLALEAPPDEEGWPLTISHPHEHSKPLKEILLKNSSISGSGLQKGRHILDPRTGFPAQHNIGAWALAPNAATSDALSTAFMIMAPEEIIQFCQRHPEIRGLTIPHPSQSGRAALQSQAHSPLLDFYSNSSL